MQAFLAGAGRDDRGHLVTNGGRLLGVTATGADLDEARTRAYAAADRIRIAGARRARAHYGWPTVAAAFVGSPMV